MNQDGWGLKDFLFILGIITLALIITAGKPPPSAPGPGT